MTLCMTLNQTHDPARWSWVESANEATCDFPLQNLPYGVFRTNSFSAPRIGIAIGDQILDLAAVSAAGLLPEAVKSALFQSDLNELMSKGPAIWQELRARLSDLLGADTCAAQLRARLVSCLTPQVGAEMRLPARIGGYTDFYASLSHATNVGSMFRPDQPLLPNYQWVPIGYHGRSSSVHASGGPVYRPHGQFKRPGAVAPDFGPTQSLDYELEIGAFVGPGNNLGEPIPVAQAANHLFGVVLLNDWSARDIQQWEYQPLGPFLAKNFATTISPWVVTCEALAPFRVPAMVRPAGCAAPLPYLFDPGDQTHGGFNVTVEAWLRTRQMRESNQPAGLLSTGSFRSMYWTLAQLLAHHTSNGCNLQPGDLLGSGTISGEAKGSRGCLLELTAGGTDPLLLPDGEQRGFLEDGDEVLLRGYCKSPGARRIGLGECRGLVLPARS